MSMKKSGIACLTLTVAVLIIIAGCHSDRVESVHSLYYWSTVFTISDQQKAFIDHHNISRIYLRYFDVVVDSHDEVMPNATCVFKSRVPDSTEVIPTVFIVNEVMRRQNDSLPELILRRVLQMSETNLVPMPKEIQIDCDWTQSTQQRYFEFLSHLHELTDAKGMTLSATIRLHQLALPVPPVDRGVLMVYNTGDVTRLDVSKPILDPKDIAPYIKWLPDYQLPLTEALPLFSWKVLFRGGKYVGIMHSADEYPVIEGDSIVLRQPCMDDIMQAKRMVECRDDIAREIILFDMNNNNITRFTDNEYEEIYHY